MSTNAVASAAKVVGSQTALAKILGCTPQNVQRMCATGRVPAEHVLKIEAASGVSRHDLRPDLYPEASPALTGMMLHISLMDQSGKTSGNPSSIEVAR